MTSILANNDVDCVPEISDCVCTCLTAYVLHFSLDCSFEFSCGLWGVLTDLSLRCPHSKKSSGLKSGECGGHSIFVFNEMKLSPSVF